ncbi:flagellin [Sulfurimonas sp.]|uniref:flagellin N-terminal helical domain-containing protein n=1 Tax=Sulfurimonas sp. TaxID=2022749 RepID=UPI003D0B44A3
MGFRINTNIAAMDAHRNSTMNNIGLDKSLKSLSSGLRINTAADDASGLTIANSLKAQSTGLGQAIRNANDGIGVTQTADGALDEYENIINTVRTKAIQAASDGQNDDSRAAIQRDIDKLLEEADNIAKTTSFNGQKLLDGTFNNKAFHIGAYANETVGLSISSTRIDDVGQVKSVSSTGTFNAAIDETGDAAFLEAQDSGAYGIAANGLVVNSVDVTRDLNANYPDDLLSAKSVASAIASSTGITAIATTTLSGGAITADSTDDSAEKLLINGYSIGSVSWEANDASGSLTNAINAISSYTGVTAEIVNNKLELTAEDGRNIAIDTVSAGTLGAGLTDSTTTITAATVGTLEVGDTAAVTLTAGELVINGVDLAGVYGDGSTAGSAADALEAAIKNIEGLNASSIDDSGVITLTRNDGKDINVNSSGTTYAAAASQGIFNSSNKGSVEIYSDNLVTVSGTTDQLGFKPGSYTPSESESLDTVDVTTREAANVAIKIADSALKQLDEIRSNLGSTQNQLESTVRNISVTQVNVAAAESQIRDVDFAAESATFAKHNILAQSGAYAMSQANAVQQNVMRLLQ